MSFQVLDLNGRKVLIVRDEQKEQLLIHILLRLRELNKARAGGQ